MRATNLSYFYKDKKTNFENKDYFKILEKIYKEEYFDDNYVIDIKINIISAWKS